MAPILFSRGMLAMCLLGTASAHIQMAFPVPFDLAALDTSPLDPTGANYPCKVGKSGYSYKITAMNKIPVNEAVLLDFKGTAVHSGGTCQLSISLDKEPTAQSVFKVIQTFEGGCPTAEGAGGLTFDIPKEFPTTERATLAWSWYNKVGNREFYMNCAPIEITGGSDSKDYYESLPDMFKANIAGSDFKTVEGGDPIVPDPGQFIITADTAQPTAVTGGAASQNKQQVPAVSNLASYAPPASDANQISSVGGAGDSGSGGAASTAPAGNGNAGASQSYNNGQYTESAAAPAQPTSVAMSSIAPSASVPVYSQPATDAAPIDTSSAATSAPAPSTSAPQASSSTFSTFTIPASGSSAPAYSAPASSAPATSVAAPPAYPTLSPSLGQGVSGPSSGSTASPTGSSSPPTNSCPADGAVVCSTDGTQFGLCDHGSVVFQVVAAGTKCSNGNVQKRSAHVRRHAHGAYKVRASWT